MPDFDFQKSFNYPDIHAGPFRVFEALNFEGIQQLISSTSSLLVVFVEARLLDGPGGETKTVTELMHSLKQFNRDLRVEGYDSRFVKVEMHDPPGHRDGEGVLALRKFLQDTQTKHPSLAGAIFIGAFPEAMLVRRWIWRKDNQTIWINGNSHSNVDYLWVTPETIAMRSDIVLADLDGNWSNIYNSGPVQIDDIKAIPDESVPKGWPANGGLFTSSEYQISPRTFEDFFYIKDDTFVQIPDPTSGNRLILQTSHTIGGPELATSDQAAANPIARPEILISRINARNVALSPNPNIIGTSGEGLLDPLGKPRAITTGYSVQPNQFQPDIELERQLIVDYLDRNHRFRQGITRLGTQYRTAAINGFPPNATPPSPEYGADLAKYLERAAQFIHGSVVAERANLLEFVQWMKKPAILKGIITHANSTGTVWNGSSYSVAQLESEVGGAPWYWKENVAAEGITYAPSLEDQGSWGNLPLYRTLWENDTLKTQHPSHILHTGCDVNSPSLAESQPYSSASYASKQEGEAWLFYMNAVTVTCRSKDINDRPLEFSDALSKPDACIGSAWAHYFDVLSKDAARGTFENTTRAKDSYWWGILGDWTLQLSFEPELIIPFIPVEVHVIPFKLPDSILADKRTIIKPFENPRLAEKALKIIRAYGFTERRIVGGDHGNWEYFLTNGSLPKGALDNENSIEINAERVMAKKSRSGWQVRSGRDTIASVANEIEAWAIVEIIRSHKPTHACWLGDRDAPAMRYLRS